MRLKVKINQNGSLDLGSVQQSNLKAFSGRWGEFRVDEDETDAARGYFEGCLVKLFVFYHGKNWKDSKVCQDAREDIKKHFNGETREDMFTGQVERYGKSTKGKEALAEVTLQLTDYLTENYHAPYEALDSEGYRIWRDSKRDYGEDDTYIDYMLREEVLDIPI
jgi:hypothetical protein